MHTPNNQIQSFGPEERVAIALDAADPLRGYREKFHIPLGPDGKPVIYFCGNSLGLQPKATREMVTGELDDWAAMGVEGHFEGRRPWYPYHEQFREIGARLVGARPGEVVMMNSLTVNLHLLMVSFYRPTAERYKILIDWPAFPSDIYAVKSQIECHGYDAANAFVVARPRDGENTVRTEDVEAMLERDGKSIALVLFAGVNYFTGQFNDIQRITAAAHRQGCVAGWDLAHAAGNVPLALHDWDVDFAAWCSYKYLNSGPGAVAGAFVHERHGRDTSLPRFAGWWGNDPATRFKMHLQPEFVAREGADGWQISNPPIMAMAPVLASLRIFDEAGMAALREKSERLTGYLEYLIDRIPNKRFEIITPREPAERGCQLSILAHEQPKQLSKRLQEADIVVDFREPNVIRVAPVPLYNSFHDAWRFANVLGEMSADLDAAQTLLAEIRIVFGPRMRGKGLSLQEGEVVDDYGDEAEMAKAWAAATDRNWWEVTDDILDACPNALSYLELESLAYYIPAIMSYNLRKQHNATYITESLEYALQSDRVVDLANLLSPAERHLIFKYLEWCARAIDYNDPDSDARKAIEEFWNRYSCAPGM